MDNNNNRRLDLNVKPGNLILSKETKWYTVQLPDFEICRGNFVNGVWKAKSWCGKTKGGKNEGKNSRIWRETKDYYMDCFAFRDSIEQKFTKKGSLLTKIFPKYRHLINWSVIHNHYILECSKISGFQSKNLLLSNESNKKPSTFENINEDKKKFTQLSDDDLFEKFNILKSKSIFDELFTPQNPKSAYPEIFDKPLIAKLNTDDSLTHHDPYSNTIANDSLVDDTLIDDTSNAIDIPYDSIADEILGNDPLSDEVVGGCFDISDIEDSKNNILTFEENNQNPQCTVSRRSSSRTKKLLLLSKQKIENEKGRKIIMKNLEKQREELKKQKSKRLQTMMKMEYKQKNGSFTSKSANFYADLYTEQESRNGGASKPGNTINQFSKEFLNQEIDGMSRNTVFRSVIIKARIIEKHFFCEVLPNLEDCAICTDGTTLNGIHYDQFFFLGYLKDSDDIQIYVADIIPTKKSTGVEISKLIVGYIDYFVSSCRTKGTIFDVKNLKYLLADHCKNNSGSSNGAIAHLQKHYPWIQFLGCKDHLCNLLIKIADNHITTLIVKSEIGIKTGVAISNTATNKFMDHLGKIVKFFTKPSNYADFKHFCGIDLNVPKTSLNRYLNGTSLCRFLVLNYNPVLKFLKSHDYKGEKAKKMGLPKKWLLFLLNPIVVEGLILGSYLHYNLTKTLSKFHSVTSTEEYNGILSDLKNKFTTLANNPSSFLCRTIAFSDLPKGSDIDLIDGKVRNMLPSISKEFESLITTLMVEMNLKIEQYENLSLSSNRRVFSNTRVIERSFGSCEKILSKNKRTRTEVVKSVQRIRLYSDLPIHKYITEEEFNNFRKDVRKDLTKSKYNYKTTIRKMSTNKKKFTGRFSSLVSSDFVGKKRKREEEETIRQQNTGIKKKIRKTNLPKSFKETQLLLLSTNQTDKLTTMEKKERDVMNKKRPRKIVNYQE